MRNLRAPTTVAPAVGCTRSSPKSGLRAGHGRNLVANALELAAANVLEVLPLRRGGRSFIKIDRNLIALPDLRAHVPRHHHAIFQRDALDGNERHHVGGAHARMRALMRVQVDQFGGFADAANRGFLRSPRARRR